MGEIKYKNFISLGCNCAVASALERYGLRSKRGPFDWILSDWQGVEKCLETKFKDFLIIVL